MKRTIFSLSFLLIAGLVFSQQDPQFSQNMFNKLAKILAMRGAIKRFVQQYFTAHNGWVLKVRQQHLI